jgi:putative Ca2+/H+ antiporter (TMEM165/GDT1 family)
MDAIMTVLAAVLLANTDGRTGALLAARDDRRAALLAFSAAFLVLAILSAVGAVVASRTLGLGVLNLFAAMALGSAAAALLWTRRGRDDGAALAGLPVPWLFVRLLLIQLGDRNQFLILALGALSGAALWGVAGGAIGLLLAVLPVVAVGPALRERTPAKVARWMAAALLILWAAHYLRLAFGV